MGRKKKAEMFKGNHTKFTDDNVIRKIKCHFLNFINKYKKQSENMNKSLIDKIYSEKDEVETIKILEQTYIELFNKLKQEQFDEFCTEIIKKEVKKSYNQTF